MMMEVRMLSNLDFVISAYDNANRLTRISQGSANVSFGYDNDSRRTSLTLPNNVTLNYGYDALSQLTGVTYMLGTNTLGNLTFAYDLAGRRTGVGGSYARTGTPQAASAATYNANNQLTQWKGATLTYDANGNLTSDGTNTYTWNARNQLVSISGGTSASFQYDPFGRRVSKTIGGTTQYVYDGANPVQEISGTTASANLLTGGVDEYFQRTDAAGARNFLTDALGSTLALADSTGTLQTSYTFEPFGNTPVTGATTTNSFAYTGRELDATGLYFYRARYYHPILQRFVAEDPIRAAGGLNLYAYTANSPVDFRDASGLAPSDWILPNWLSNSINWNRVPGICEGGLFNFKGGGFQHEPVDGVHTFYGAFKLQDANLSLKGRKPKGLRYSQGTLIEAGGSVETGPGRGIAGGVGAVLEPDDSGERALADAFVFGGPEVDAEIPGGAAGGSLGAGGLVGYAPGHGLVLGFYGEAEGWAGNPGGFGAYGAGAYLTVTTVANCAN